MSDFTIRDARPDDEAAASHVCLKTGDSGADGEALYRADPGALGRIFTGPYLAFAPELGLIVEDHAGVCGYALGALDTRTFFARYEAEWRPRLCEQFPAPRGDPARWDAVQRIHHLYHNPDYFCPEPYADFPSHLHIDLLPRAQGRGFGRRMIEGVMDKLRRRGSPGVHLGISSRNDRARAFYLHLGFHELTRTGPADDGCVYLGKTLRA